MKNTAEKNTAVNNKVNNNSTDKNVGNTGNTPKASNLPVIIDAKKDEPKKAEVTTIVQTEQPKAEAPQAEQPKAEAPKAEPKAEPQPEPKPVKHVMNLEETLKLVAELNRRKIQRDKLMETIDNLDAFEVEIKEDADETDGNIYQGCVLTIEDDNRRKFTTKNPVIIWTVAQQVNSMCVNKLSEIEAGIILPQ
jgi:hypothetical protein